MLENLLKYMSLSVVLIVSLNDFEEILQLEFVSDLFTSVVNLLSELVSETRFFTFFSENCKDLIVRLCLPLIKSNQNDLETLVDNPEEFVAISNDLCEKQQSLFYQTAAAYLLLNLCEYID